MLGFFIGLGIGLAAGGFGGGWGMKYWIERRIDKMLKAKMGEFEKNLTEVKKDMKGLKDVKVDDLDDALKAIRDKILNWF